MAGTDRSIAEVLSDIVGDVQQIIRAEVRLAKVEVREELGQAKRGAILLVAAGVALVMTLALVEIAAVYALTTVWPAWSAALAVAVVNAGAGMALASRGAKQIRSIQVTPPRTAASIVENVQWAKTRTK